MERFSEKVLENLWVPKTSEAQFAKIALHHPDFVFALWSVQLFEHIQR